MKSFVAALVLLAVPATAFAVFSSPAPLPEPGVLELVGIGGVVLVVARLLRRKK